MKVSLRREPYTGNPYVRFDEGTEVERPPPTLRSGPTEVIIKCARCQGYGTLGKGWHDPVCPSCHGAGCQPLVGRWRIIT